jgi:mono/diheme cytochrome c family protein
MAEKRTSTETAELEASTSRWMLAGLVLMGLFVLAFPLFRFYEPAQRADAREEQVTFLSQQGAEVFAANCESCHGAAGSGAVGPAIGAKEFLESVDDRQLSQLIAVGIPGSEMVAYSNDFGGPLTSEEITAVTTYLRSLEPDAASKPNWRTPLADESLTGSALYVLACSRCHGADRMGDEALGYPDISDASITMQEPDAWIAARISEGYQEMPRFDGVLTPEQIAAVVVYLRTGSDGPAPTTTTTVAGTTTTVTTIPGETTTTTVEANPDNDEVLALGEALFQRLAGGYGCQECHGPDAMGTPNGPNIIGASRSRITNALNGGIPDMDFSPKLTSDEVEAVYNYLLWLTGREA